jgi:hypothetical protein
MSQIRVLVTEMHPLTQAGIFTILEQTQDLKPL